jgi:hypothetical protein
MSNSIDDLILDRAAAMTGHDGGHASAALIIGATAQLQAELITARDRLLNVAAGSAHAGAGAVPAEDPEATAPAVAEAASATPEAAPALAPSEAPAPDATAPKDAAA